MSPRPRRLSMASFGSRLQGHRPAAVSARGQPSLHPARPPGCADVGLQSAARAVHPLSAERFKCLIFRNQIQKRAGHSAERGGTRVRTAEEGSGDGPGEPLPGGSEAGSLSRKCSFESSGLCQGETKRRKCARLSARRRLSAPLRTRWTHAACARLGEQSAPRSWGTLEQVLAKWAASDAGGSEAWGGRGCGDHGPALAGGARRLGSHALLEEGRDLRGARDEAHGINALALLGQDGDTQKSAVLKHVPCVYIRAAHLRELSTQR